MIEFQDKKNLYFIMEYVPGGDLMEKLIRDKKFDEDLARYVTFGECELLMELVMVPGTWNLPEKHDECNLSSANIFSIIDEISSHKLCSTHHFKLRFKKVVGTQIHH